MTYQAPTIPEPSPGKDLLEINLEELNIDKAPWPRDGHTYEIVFEVEHIGKHWEDEPLVTILECPHDMAGIFDNENLRELCDDRIKGFSYRFGNVIPIASGIYRGRFEFHFSDCTPWDAAYPEFDYGFTVLGFERLL